MSPRLNIAKAANTFGLLSTEFVFEAGISDREQSMRNRNDMRRPQEVCLSSTAWQSGCLFFVLRPPVDERGERKESVDSVHARIGKPNRKERQKRSVQALLKGANTPRIKPFDDPSRQRNAWAGEQVMDRDAERVAGGKDAV
ncbi:MAG: hypothetical protein NXH72_12735 [Hyphomonadaceae bacterium]|nr:hypothetical protein [Hyphomonadaceae bacterium]